MKYRAVVLGEASYTDWVLEELEKNTEKKEKIPKRQSCLFCYKTPKGEKIRCVVCGKRNPE